MTRRSIHARLMSYLAAGSALGFALPILVPTSGATVPLVQRVDEWSGQVTEFERLDGDLATAEAIDAGAIVGVGDPQVFVFVGRNGANLYGALNDIESGLRDHADSLRDHPDIRLQIFELVGTNEEKRLARAELQEKITETLGAHSGKLYRNAALRTELWSLLLQRAPDRAAADRVLAVRSRLDAAINDLGSVYINIDSLDVRDREWADGAQLCAALASGFSFPTSSDFPARARAPFEYDAFLQHVASLGRQEERITLLLTALLSAPRQADEILAGYEDRTIFERRALEIIQHYLSKDGSHQLTWQSLIHLAAFKLYDEIFPKNRGRYLMFLAAHLGHEKNVADFVRHKLRRSKSMFVQDWAEPILDALP